MQAGDRPLFDLVEEFWPESLTYNAYIDPSFEGTFVMVHDKAIEYTNKSRFLVDVTLTGDKDTSVSGNDQDNLLTGNVGDNGFTGGAGDDVIAGVAGSDRAFFAGVASDYQIETKGAITIVTDTVAGRDGTDEVPGIEVLVFRAKEVASRVCSPFKVQIDSWEESFGFHGCGRTRGNISSRIAA